MEGPVEGLYVYLDENPPRIVKAGEATSDEDEQGYPFGTPARPGDPGYIVKNMDDDGTFYVDFLELAQTAPVEQPGKQLIAVLLPQ